MSAREELLDHYRRMREEMHAVLDGLTDDQMSDPSIDGWSVKDHLFHVAFWDDERAHEIERISAGHESALRMSEEQDAEYNDLGYDLRGDLSAAQALWELEASGRRVQAAIAAATERGLDESLYGEAGLRSTHEAEHIGWIRGWRDRTGV